MSDVVAGKFKGPKSPRQVLLDALSAADDFEVIVLVCKYKDEEIVTGWSAGKCESRIGLLEIGKEQMLRADRGSEG